MTFSIKFENIEEINRKFNEIGARVQTLIATRAVKKGAEPIRDAAVSKVPVGMTGNLSDSIKIRTGLYDVNTFESVIAVDKYYGHMVEYGHKVVRGKKVVGMVPAKPFLRPAFDTQSDRALDMMGSEIKKLL